MPEYSIVIPVFNEEESLKPLFKEVTSVMSSLGKEYEIIFVNDGSSDQSPLILEFFKKNYPKEVKIITLPQRSGQTYAMRKGLDAVQGNIAITMDADLQNDPNDIPKMLQKMNEG